MSQRTNGLYRLTQMPRLYAALQAMLGGQRSRNDLIVHYLRPNPGDRVLDIGCGSASILPDLGDVHYTGVDSNPLHIATAKQRFDPCGCRAMFHCGDIATIGKLVAAPFDLAICIGVLHHLDDSDVDELSRLVKDRLAPRGRFVTVDPAFVRGQNPIARFLAARDSGTSVRTPEGYVERLRHGFANFEVHIRHNLLRVPYTHCIIVAHAA